jgi:hypothetical protein
LTTPGAFRDVSAVDTVLVAVLRAVQRLVRPVRSVVEVTIGAARLHPLTVGMSVFTVFEGGFFTLRDGPQAAP